VHKGWGQAASFRPLIVKLTMPAGPIPGTDIVDQNRVRWGFGFPCGEPWREKTHDDNQGKRGFLAKHHLPQLNSVRVGFGFQVKFAGAAPDLIHAPRFQSEPLPAIIND